MLGMLGMLGVSICLGKLVALCKETMEVSL